MERRGRCPFCVPPDTKGHLYQNISTLAWLCFKCGARGKGELSKSQWIHEGRPSRPLDPRQTFDSLSEYASAYLRKHHVSPATARQARLGSLGNDLAVPVYNAKGELVLMQQRTLGPTKGKMWLTFGPRREIVPTYNFTSKPTGVVIIVESVISAIRLAPLFPAAALCGSRAGVEQVHQLVTLAWRRTCLVWLDRDAAQWSMMLQRVLQHSGVQRVVPVLRHEGIGSKCDPCDVDDAVVRRVVARVKTEVFGE